MSLSTGGGPLGPMPEGRFTPPIPAGVVYVEPHPRRIQAIVDGHVVVDTERALLVHRPGRTLTYAFLPDDVGTLPNEPDADAPGYVDVPWDAVDEWREEGRALVHYPPNPYHRVDCRPTRRRLRATVDDAILVDTDDTVIVFETSLPARLYVRPELVRTDLLWRSDTTSYCNYKGHATYWHAVVGGRVVEDVAWSYEDPLPESLPITGHLSFGDSRVDVDADLPEPGRTGGRDDRNVLPAE